MEFSCDLKIQFDSKKYSKKVLNVYENVITKGKADEGKGDRLVAHLNAEAFEYYFDHFTDDNARIL